MDTGIVQIPGKLDQRILAMGSGYWDGPFFRNGSIAIHPRANEPSPEGLRRFWSLAALERWVTDHEQVVAEKKHLTDQYLEELDQLYKEAEKREENKFILALCQETGIQGTEEEIISGFRERHPMELIRQAMGIGVEGQEALTQLRKECGL